MFFFIFFFLFSFFCQSCPVLWSSKSVFLILKISQYGWRWQWFQIFLRNSYKNWYKNWYLHFHKTYDCQICQQVHLREFTKVRLIKQVLVASSDQNWSWATSDNVHLPFGYMVLRDCEKTKEILFSPPQCLWPPNLVGWWLTLRNSFP